MKYILVTIVLLILIIGILATACQPATPSASSAQASDIGISKYIFESDTVRVTKFTDWSRSCYILESKKLSTVIAISCTGN